jgi:hypothetical protein
MSPRRLLRSWPRGRSSDPRQLVGMCSRARDLQDGTTDMNMALEQVLYQCKTDEEEDDEPFDMKMSQGTLSAPVAPRLSPRCRPSVARQEGVGWPRVAARSSSGRLPSVGPRARRARPTTPQPLSHSLPRRWCRGESTARTRCTLTAARVAARRAVKELMCSCGEKPFTDEEWNAFVQAADPGGTGRHVPSPHTPGCPHDAPRPACDGRPSGRPSLHAVGWGASA